MAVDYKTAKHACNVIKRQIQSTFPELCIYFLIHEENKRYSHYLREKNQILSLEGGHNLCNFLDEPEQKQRLNANRSRLICLSLKRKPGFLGFSKQNNYIALCTLNIDRFTSLENLNNHALHLAWHAINLYSQNKDKASIGEDNVLLYNINTESYSHQNLLADIFSCSLQKLLGNDKILDTLPKQRMQDTLHNERGFFAEKFPFPVCVETLEFTLKNSMDQYKRYKSNVQTAVQITKDIGNTYDQTSIEKWLSFALPAQEMAWLDHPPEKILGAAIYTGENTYAQSIADMIAEKMNIKPEIIASLNDYNPFANNEVNIRLHKKMCMEKYKKITEKIRQHSDHSILMEHMKIENSNLCNGSPIGWCAHGLSRAITTFQKFSNDETGYQQAMEQAHIEFEKEIDSLAWDTLQMFAREIFYRKRVNQKVTIDTLREIALKDEEYGSIHAALNFTNPVINQMPPEQKTKSLSEHSIPLELIDTEV